MQSNRVAMSPEGKTAAMSREHRGTAGMKASDAPRDEYRFPDFICIGVQKAGTSWLDINLRRHPGLWFPPIKELQYFNEIHIPSNRKWTGQARELRGKKALTQYIRATPRADWDYRLIAVLADIASGRTSDDWYGRIFSLAAPERICGEITPDYANLPDEGIRHVLRLSPDVKIMLSLRDPIERSWSHIRMMAKNKKNEVVPDIERMARYPDLLRRADYPAIIRDWTARIPRERMHVIFMDDIAADPGTVLKGVCAFLGVEYRDTVFQSAANPVHVGEEKEMPPRIAAILKERLRPVYEEFAEFYPERAAGWMARHYG
jgi:hypothetical protein